MRTFKFISMTLLLILFSCKGRDEHSEKSSGAKVKNEKIKIKNYSLSLASEIKTAFNEYRNERISEVGSVHNSDKLILPDRISKIIEYTEIEEIESLIKDKDKNASLFSALYGVEKSESFGLTDAPSDKEKVQIAAAGSAILVIGLGVMYGYKKIDKLNRDLNKIVSDQKALNQRVFNTEKSDLEISQELKKQGNLRSKLEGLENIIDRRLNHVNITEAEYDSLKRIEIAFDNAKSGRKDFSGLDLEIDKYQAELDEFKAQLNSDSSNFELRKKVQQSRRNWVQAVVLKEQALSAQSLETFDQVQKKLGIDDIKYLKANFGVNDIELESLESRAQKATQAYDDAVDSYKTSVIATSDSRKQIASDIESSTRIQSELEGGKRRVLENKAANDLEVNNKKLANSQERFKQGGIAVGISTIGFLIGGAILAEEISLTETENKTPSQAFKNLFRKLSEIELEYFYFMSNK